MQAEVVRATTSPAADQPTTDSKANARGPFPATRIIFRHKRRQRRTRRKSQAEERGRTSAKANHANPNDKETKTEPTSLTYLHIQIRPYTAPIDSLSSSYNCFFFLNWARHRDQLMEETIQQIALQRPQLNQFRLFTAQEAAAGSKARSVRSRGGRWGADRVQRV